MADIDLSVAEPTVTITEFRTPFLYDLQRLIFDSPVITEAIFVGLRSLTNDIILSRFDSVAIVEVATIHPERRISVSDNVTVVNEVTNLGSFAQGFVKEIFVIDERLVKINEFAAAGTPVIDRFDTSTITEVVSLTFQADLSINVNDSVATSDAFYSQHDASDIDVSVFDVLGAITEYADRTWAQPPSFRYVDLVSGNDANNGLTWARAKKTLTAISGLTISDIVKIAKTDDPILITNNALWSDNSPFVGIPEGIVKLVDDGGEEESWNAAVNATASINVSQFKSGIRAASLTMQSLFTTGKVGWTRLNPRNPQTVDFSAYSQLSFNLQFTTAHPVNNFKICLCSDYDGDVIVDSFTVPYAVDGRWYPFQIARDGGGNLGSAIKSVALYCLIDTGIQTVNIDTIYACNDLGLGSLIGRNIKHPTDPFQSDLMWWTIRHFDMNGTRICLGPPDGVGLVTASTATNCHRFQKMTDRGESASVSSTAVIADYGKLYSRKPFFKTNVSGGQALEGFGTSAIFSGGWNKITGEQDGETFYDNISGFNAGFNVGSSTAIFEKIGIVRCSINWNSASTPVQGHILRDVWSVSAVSQSFGSSFSPGLYSLFKRVWNSGRNASISPLLTTFEHYFSAYSNDSGQALLTASGGGPNYFRKCKFIGHAQNNSAIQFSSSSIMEDTWLIRAPGGSCWINGNADNVRFYRCLFESLGGNGIKPNGSMDLRFVDCTFRNNGGGDVVFFTSNPGYKKGKFINCKLLSANRVVVGLDTMQIDPDTSLQWQKEEQVEKAHKRLMVWGTIQNELTNFRTQAPCISMLSNTNITQNGGLPSFFDDYFRKEWNLGKLLQRFSAPVTKGVGIMLSIYMKAEPGFNGEVWISAEYETRHVVKPVLVSPVLNQGYQQYSVVVPANEIDDDGVVQLVVATEKDALHKIFLDDFNWA